MKSITKWIIGCAIAFLTAITPIIVVIIEDNKKSQGFDIIHNLENGLMYEQRIIDGRGGGSDGTIIIEKGITIRRTNRINTNAE